MTVEHIPLLLIAAVVLGLRVLSLLFYAGHERRRQLELRRVPDPKAGPAPIRPTHSSRPWNAGRIAPAAQDASFRQPPSTRLPQASAASGHPFRTGGPNCPRCGQLPDSIADRARRVTVLTLDVLTERISLSSVEPNLRDEVEATVATVVTWWSRLLTARPNLREVHKALDPIPERLEDSLEQTATFAMVRLRAMGMTAAQAADALYRAFETWPPTKVPSDGTPVK